MYIYVHVEEVQYTSTRFYSLVENFIMQYLRFTVSIHGFM